MDNLYFTIVYNDGSVNSVNIDPSYLRMIDPYVFNEDNIEHIAAIVRETE